MRNRRKYGWNYVRRNQGLCCHYLRWKASTLFMKVKNTFQQYHVFLISSSLGSGVGGGGVQNPWKRGRSPWKSGQNWRPTLFDFKKKTAPNVCRKTKENPPFGGHTKTRLLWPLWEKICKQKSQNHFSGKFGEIRAKILRIPKNLLAPAPTSLGVRRWILYTQKQSAVHATLYKLPR